ncbi:beta-N-acetylglucosaminidase [Bacteroides sp. 224]|nr:beta-N-acetylglucosaminidase [Bacteroides sp. 224]
MLAALTACFLFCGNLTAQQTGFDFSGQRRESQKVLTVPGQKLDHKGIIINPTPQELKIGNGDKLDISKGLALNAKNGDFSVNMDFVNLNKKGAKLNINFGADKAAKLGVKAVSGAYSLSISNKGITITGYDERGAFYGIQTLRQIIESPASANFQLPYLEIKDHPDLPHRGVIEGFYGNPWSHETRLSLIEFYGRFKMNIYFYGPKDDPYHSSPHWRLPYPEKEAMNIKELIMACNRNRVDFVWAIHPGKDIKWNEEDYQNLKNKLEGMYDLGVRSFAIFFDDITGEGVNPVKQTELTNRVNEEFVKVKGDVTPLVICPTDYSKAWAKPGPDGALSIYGKTLDPSVQIFWTGDVVCSDLTKETMDWINSRIKRPAFYWWNYPVTDYIKNTIVLQGPVYGLNTSLTADDLCGFGSNPMENGEASKLALYGVSDYSWNIAAYNPIDNWERGIAMLVPGAAEAYRTFAIHSCDTETGYRRAESWETETFRIDNYTQEQFKALLSEFEKIEKVPAQMEAGCTNKALLNELRPWLTEFGKLGTRGRKTFDAIKYHEAGDQAGFWNTYVENSMSKDDKKAYDTHKSGTLKLQPFYVKAMDDMLYKFFTALTGKLPESYKAVGTYANVSSVSSKLMFDNDDSTFYTTGKAQRTGHWVGVDVGYLKEISEVHIIQGRRSEDVDYFDHTILEYSETGKDWAPLTDSIKNQYVINWTGEPIKARYVRLRKLQSAKTNWMAVRRFDINPVRREKLGFNLEANDESLQAFDYNPITSFMNSGIMSFGVAPNVAGYTLLLKLPTSSQATTAVPVKFRQFDAKGKLLSEVAIDSHFFKAQLVAGASRIEIEGKVEIFEILPQGI